MADRITCIMKYAFVVGFLVCYLALIILEGESLYSYVRREYNRKYSPNNKAVSTVTPSYTLQVSEILLSEDFDDKFAKLRIENQDFLATVDFRKPFDQDDTDAIKIEHPEVVCMPDVFGYSKAQGDQVFPPYEYPDCAEKVSGPQALIEMDYEKNTLDITCPNKETPTYVTLAPEFDPKKQYLQFEMQDSWEPKRSPKVLSPRDEFVYASCSEPPNYNSASYVPRFNLTAHDRAKEIMKSKGAARPLSILMLTVDSFSRRHFFRKLPKTVALLNSLNGNSTYSVFDFKINNIQDAATVDNIVPFFGNQTKVEYKNPPDRDILGDSAMWNKFREQGFVTYAAFENCDYFVPATIGRSIHTDHFTRSFYCAANHLLDLRMAKNSGMTQRCIGSHMSHYYLLNYTRAFSDLYDDVNQWIYMHLNAAHESTGQHAATLDNDLVNFLAPYLANTDRDLVVFFQGDHGMRYGNWFKDIEAYQENKLPALFFIVPNRVLDNLPYSYDSLWHNTKRLVSKRDIRASVLSLLEWPYGELHDVHEEPYLDRYYNLFAEKVPANRTCDDILVYPWHCSCLVMQLADPDLYELDGSLHGIVHTVIEGAIENINQRVYANPMLPLGSVCLKLSFKSVLKVYGLQINNVLEQMQIQFTVNEHPTAIFEVYSVFGTQERGHIMRPDAERGAAGVTVYRGFKTRIRFIGISRKDSYAGPCESISRSYGLKAEFCVCE